MSLRETLERMMVAVTFAEANQHETAREVLREREQPRKSKRPSGRPRPRQELRAPSLNG